MNQSESVKSVEFLSSLLVEILFFVTGLTLFFFSVFLITRNPQGYEALKAIYFSVDSFVSNVAHALYISPFGMTLAFISCAIMYASFKIDSK